MKAQARKFMSGCVASSNSAAKGDLPFPRSIPAGFPAAGSQGLERDFALESSRRVFADSFEGIPGTPPRSYGSPWRWCREQGIIELETVPAGRCRCRVPGDVVVWLRFFAGCGA